MTVGAVLGAWPVVHRNLGTPPLIAAVAAGLPAVVTSGRERSGVEWSPTMPLAGAASTESLRQGPK